MESGNARGASSMSSEKDTLFELFELLKRSAPQYLDLLTSKTDDEFEAAFDVLLEKAVEHLEQNKANFQNLDEEALSAVLAAKLDMPGLAVTQEPNSNGHVDLMIRVFLCKPTRTKLCEAKIYDGPAYHLRGLEQLLGRYTTGRESRGLLISYVRKKDIKSLIDKLRAEMDSKRPLQQKGSTQDHRLKWSFVTLHGHDSGEDLQVGHIGCNLYIGERNAK
jgi:hypothetical protein